jgi:ribosome biogenesis GTPase / thiamine phosphate phosphatase
LAKQNATHQADSAVEGQRCGALVVRTHGGHFYVQTDDGVVDCLIRGRLKRERRGTDLVAIGDRVCWTPTEEGRGVIESVAPRQRVLSRRLPSPRPGVTVEREQVIVANPDQVLVVFAYRNPPANPLMLDRYLVACEAAELPVIIVANKYDLGPDDDQDPFALYREIGYRVVETSAVTGENLETLREMLRHKLSVLTGPSGVGKSSLLNALWPHLDLRVGEISEYHDRGKHTTVVAELLRPEPDIAVADTPGLRVFLFYDIDPEQLDAFFPEMRPYLGQCRFQPCTHTHEPDCAIQAAVERGEISLPRYESYLRMFENAY